MGFTAYEKQCLKELIRPTSETSKLRDLEIPKEALDYLKSVDLTHHIHDFSLFPLKFFHRKNKAENIIIGKFVNSDMNIYEELENLTSFLTPTFRIQVDFGFLIKNGMNTDDSKFRFVFPQRSLAFNSKIHINNLDDIRTFLAEFKTISRSELTQRVFQIHQNQSCFDRSGYNPFYLINMSIFLAKI